jgi:hypothetical protein
MIDPVPAPCVMLDREFPSRPLDRCPSRQQPLNPHPCILDSVRSGNPSVAPFAPPRLRLIKKTRSPRVGIKSLSPQKISSYSTKLRRGNGGATPGAEISRILLKTRITVAKQRRSMSNPFAAQLVAALSCCGMRFRHSWPATLLNELSSPPQG